MEIIIIAIVAIFLLSRHVGGTSAGIPTGTVSGPIPSTSAPAIAPTASSGVIKNSVGTSLSTALGNDSRSPAHYTSGNPGTTANVPSSTIQFTRPPINFKFPPTISSPGMSGAGVTQHTPFRPIFVPARPSVGSRFQGVNSALVNPTQVNRFTRSPEQQGAFWTKPNIALVVSKKTGV